MASDGGFSNRLAYIRWLRSAGFMEPENDKEFAAALGIEYGWLHKWKDSEKPPTDRPSVKALVAGVAAMGVTEDWLIDGRGEPIQPELWKVWERERKRPRFRHSTGGVPFGKTGAKRESA